jgi:hypothetical protein
MLTELRGKGGCLCQPAKEGKLRCPLIVRPNSEDAITGNLFQVLGSIDARRWLPDLLNTALGALRFRRQVYRQLRIELWKNRPCYPRELLPWDEGSTQVDATITWENPPTTVFVEMKYDSTPASRTARHDARHGYPGDQIIRNIRVGLLECGWFRTRPLFPTIPRDFVFVLIGHATGEPLIERYRRPDQVYQAIPHSDRLAGLPSAPFVGELSYRVLRGVLLKQARWLNRAERRLAEQLTDYLELKISNRSPARAAEMQSSTALKRDLGTRTPD